jgi:hypothetical protein
MSRLWLLLTSGVLVLLSLWNGPQIATSFEWLIATNDKLDQMRYIIAGLLFTYAVLPEIIRQYLREIMMVVGLILAPLGLATFIFHGYFQSMGYYFYPLETVAFFESGVILLMAAINTTARDSYEYDNGFGEGAPHLRFRRS